MKKLVFFFLLICLGVEGQNTIYTMNGTGGNAVGNPNISYACSGLTNSANIALIAEQTPGSSSIKFYLAKRTVSTCSPGGNSNFSGGTFRLFQSGIQVGGDVAVGTNSVTSPAITRTMPHTTGTRTFTAQFISSASSQTWSISNIVVTATPVCNLAAPSTGSVATNSITTNSFTGSWNAISGASSYTVDVEINGDSYPGTQYTTTATSYNFPNLNSGTTYKYQVRSNCSNGVSGDFGPTITTATTLTPQPNLTIGNNVSFGTTTLYSGVNYTGTFSVSNTGSAAWSGSMYVLLSSGANLSAGSATINAGATQSYSVSYTPNITASNVGVSASYQTGGQGSGITVPSQSASNINIIGNLAVTGNTVSPLTGVQNSTNFTFSATTSNVAPSPTATVDIEFISPDGVTNTVANISRSGNNYSHSRTLQQVGVYQYRYIAYQGTRPNAATAWQSVTVTAPQPNLTIGANVSFGGTTLYAGVPYTTTFSVSNTGSAAWSGSMYVALSNGNTLSIGSATINAGSTNNFSYSFTPSASDVGAGITATAKYQTGGTGSGINVPNQTIPTINIIGNLGITGNTISPTSGTQNVTNFTFGATLSNVAPIPTLAPTVDIEFLAPDGLTYTTTNIPNTSGNIFSKTQTLQQAGTYQYRYITYQSTRPNAATAWQSVIVSSNQSVTVSSPAASSTYQVGTSLPIVYAFTGYTGNVSIEITAGATGTTAILPAIADGEPNTGSKSWLIPATFTPGQYRIKVYNTGSGSIVNYSGVFTITGNAACPNCLSAGITETNFPNTGNEGFCAAQYLCNLGIIQPQQNNAGYTPVDPIKRADLAKLMLYALFDDGYAGTYHQNPSILSFPVDSYVTPFEDLNYNNNPANYDRPAKVMSYLYYANDNKGLTPFKRARTNFYPYENITRMDFLQVLLEAWNVPSDATVNAPFTDDFTNVPAETRQYINKAYSLGIITYDAVSNPRFRPNDDIKREEAYTILARLRKLTTVTKPAQAVLTNAANYIFERNITTDNISIMRSMGEGNFAYGEDAFAIGDIGFPLSFGFSYNSFATHLPDVYRRIEPLGIGWTHNLNSYIQTTSASVNEGNIVVGKALLLLANGDGTWHTYDNSNPSSPMKRSIDNFNTLNVITNSTTTYYEVKRPDQVTFKYEKQGNESGLFRLTSIKDRYGNTLSIVYKQGANVPFSGYSQVIDYVQSHSGKRIVFTYNTDNQIIEVQFPGKTSATPRRLQFAYYAGWDGKTNYLRKFTSAKHYGTTKGTIYTYGSGLQKHLLMSVKRPKGNEIRTEFGTDNKLQKIEEKSGTSTTSTTTIARTTGGTCPQGTTCATITNSDNTITSQKINLVGTIYEITSPTVSFKLPEYSVNPSNPAYFEVNGKRTQYEYNGVGNVLIVKYMKADNTTIHSTESFGYDQYNNLSTHTDRNGITTNFDFSTDGKFLDGIRRPFAQNQTINQTFRYYPNGLLKEAISHEGINTLFYYDNHGNNNRIEFPLLSLNSSATHDYAGRTLTVTNAKNQVSTFEHDDNDNLTKTIAPSPLSYVTQYGFDDNDLLNTITNAKGKVTTISRDNFDRVETITFETMQQKYYYRTDGKLDKYEKTGFATNNTRYFQYAYDAQGRMTSNRYLTNVTFDNTTKNIQTITGGTSALLLKDFTFDELNRPTGYTDNNNIAVGYGYDNNGNVTRIDYPNGHKVYYTYDQANRLRTVKWNTTTVATYVYVGSRLSYVQYGNGVRTTYNYDNAGRLDGMTTKTNNGSGSTISGYTFEFDNLGNHLAENMTEPYNTLPTPPASTTTYTYKTNNQIETAGNIAFTHDGDGNIITKGELTYTYDLEDNLISITGNGLDISFQYDAMGNRRIATRNSTVTKYVLDMLGMADVLAELNGSNAAQNYYIHGLGLVARVKGDGSTIHYYHADFRGSVVAMTNASQTITHKYQYDEYGNLTNSQEADNNPFRYVGTYGIMYETADLSYMRARYYDPTIGRFNSTDPIWSTNLYPYANNNPIMNVDANGENPLIIAGAVVGAVVGGISAGMASSKTGSGLAWDIAKGVAFGAVSGALFAGVGIGAGTAAKFAYGALDGIIGTMATETITGTETPFYEYAVNGVIGGISGGLVDAKLFYKGSSNITPIRLRGNSLTKTQKAIIENTAAATSNLSSNPINDLISSLPKSKSTAYPVTIPSTQYGAGYQNLQLNQQVPTPSVSIQQMQMCQYGCYPWCPK